MSTDTTTETTALTKALLEAGWTYAKPVHTESQWRSQIHELEHPDGRLQLSVSRFPAGNTIAQLSAEAIRSGDRLPGWMIELNEVPLTVALAAVKAAAEPEAWDLASALTASGWRQDEDFRDSVDGRLLERAWFAPDDTRSVIWNPGDDGGWTVTRPGRTERRADSQASAYTPAAVLAALVLTD